VLKRSFRVAGVVMAALTGMAACAEDTNESPAPGGTETPVGETVIGPDGTQLDSGTIPP